MGQGKWALAAAAAAWMAVAEPAFAQEEASNIVVYDQTFFSRFSPLNAEDMLRRIPGVAAILDDTSNQQERGFGSAGSQVLVNGRRFPGKNTQITTTLRRLPSVNVERVELIRGASGAIDVQNEGVVVNIVLKDGASLSQAQITYDLSARFNDEGKFGVDGLLSYSANWAGIDYGFGVERNLWTPPSGGAARWSNRFRRERYYYPNGALLEERPQFWDRDHSKWIYAANAGYEWANGDRASLNGLYQTLRITEIDDTPFIRYSATGAETLRARDYHQRDIDISEILEIGGEYTAGVGPGDLKALFIVNRTERPTLDFRNRYETTRTVEVSRSVSQVQQSEDILRASFVWPNATGQTLELGGEIASNTLDQHLQAFFDTDGDGRLEAITIPTAQAEVDEIRGEVFANHKWVASPTLSVDSALNYEYSKLSTNYPFQPERTLGFIKPRLDVRFKPTSSDQIRFIAARTVSQLDFANFVPKYNIPDDRIEAGNPGLEPEKIWSYELAYERRLPRDGGVIEARVFYDDITDAIDKVPLVQGGFLVSALGNLPTAERYGVEGEASLRLDTVGLKDAVLSLRYLRQWSETIDPFTGETRRLGGDRHYNFDVGFRHDLTALQTSYGFSYRDLGNGSIISDLTARELFTIAPILEAFVERNIFGRTTLRFEIQNITGSYEYKSRTLYLDDIRNGVVRRLETFKETRDLRMALRLRGRF